MFLPPAVLPSGPLSGPGCGRICPVTLENVSAPRLPAAKLLDGGRAPAPPASFEHPVPGGAACPAPKIFAFELTVCVTACAGGDANRAPSAARAASNPSLFIRPRSRSELQVRRSYGRPERPVKAENE